MNYEYCSEDCPHVKQEAKDIIKREWLTITKSNWSNHKIQLQAWPIKSRAYRKKITINNKPESDCKSNQIWCTRWLVTCRKQSLPRLAVWFVKKEQKRRHPDLENGSNSSCSNNAQGTDPTRICIHHKQNSNTTLYDRDAKQCTSITRRWHKSNHMHDFQDEVKSKKLILSRLSNLKSETSFLERSCQVIIILGIGRQGPYCPAWEWAVAI